MANNVSAFQQFKEKLINKQGHVVIVYPFHHFIYWAKKLTYKVLGKPLIITKDKWIYNNNKVIHFVLVNHPCDDHRLYGLKSEQIIVFDGYITDDFWGIQ